MSITTIARTVCKYPGCGEPAAPVSGTGRPPEYCTGRGHTRVSAWRERRRLAAEQAGTTISPAEDGSPLTTAKMTGVELLRSLRAEADRITAIGAGLRDRIDTLTDPTAAEQRTATAEARAAAAEQRAATADHLRAEADAAAEEMSEHLTAAQALIQAADQRATAAEQERDAAVTQARAQADQRVAAAEAERDAAIAQARADAGQRVCAAEADRDQARQAAADAEAAARQAQQETARA
jgi:colicin import membrane protein